MEKNYIKNIVAKIVQSKISKQELDELKKFLKSDPALKDNFKKEIGFFMALKVLDDLVLEQIIEKHVFLPNLDTKTEEKTVETISQKEIQFSPTLVIQSIYEKIQSLNKQGSLISREIKAEVARFLEDIKPLSDIQESIVPLLVETVTYFGAEETDKPKGPELKYLSRNIRLRFLPFQQFKMEDFTFRFAGILFYVSYEKENFKVLKDRKVNLTTDTGSPFIFTTTFKETHNSVIARFKLEFEEILSVEDSTASKENYHEFFLNIE